MNIDMISLIVANTLIYSAPLIFTSLGGVFSERSGVVNVGLEGIMVVGAFTASIVNLTFVDTLGSMTIWVSLLAAGLAGLIFSLIHALATVTLRADHIISGTVLNLIAPALCIFLTRVLNNGKGQTEGVSQSFGYFTFPLLSKIPIIGDILFSRTSLPAYIGILVAIIIWFIIFKTDFGLRLRAVGENPQAADTLGINVYKMRYIGIMLSGLLGGIGGGVLLQSISMNFSHVTVAGQGFIAMAAMIFGKWNPIGAMLAAIFFGFAQSLSIVGSQIPIISTIPSVFLQIAPYVITIVILVTFVGYANGPASIGKNYIKSK